MEDKYIKISVEGKSSKKWIALKEKFFDTIESLLETVIDSNTNSTLGDEINDFKSLLLDYGKNKLAKPGIDNAKTLAEIENLYSQKIKTIAEARKLNAEAEKIDFETKLRKLKLSITIMKALISREPGEESILISKEIDTILFALNRIEELSE